jgi:uncharacterized protein YuzE
VSSDVDKIAQKCIHWQNTLKNMKVHYDPTEDAMYIRLTESPYFESEEIQDGVLIDRDQNGDITGIELLDVSKKVPQLDTSEFKYEVSSSE